MTAKQRKQDDSIALRKQLIQMRLELNRQKICHEGLVLLEPIDKLRGYKQRLSEGSTPLLIVAGVTLVSFFMARKRRSVNGFMPILRVASNLLPLFITASSTQTDKNKSHTGTASKPH